MIWRRRSGLLTAVCVLAVSVGWGRTIHVDGDAPGSNDGSSWANAYLYLQDGLSAAGTGDEIRVAEGVYRPDKGLGRVSGDREASFELKTGVTLRGGYAGYGQAEPDLRDIQIYETILSGDLAGDDAVFVDACDLAVAPSRSENSYHVVTGSGTDATAVLDGVTVSGGNDDRSLCPMPELCIGIAEGGGMHNVDGSPTVKDCTFTLNSAYWEGHPHGGAGGGIFNGGSSSPHIVDCVFRLNWAETGGGLCNGGNNRPEVTNCIFADNAARYSGGGLHNRGGGAVITSCTFEGNSAASGAGASNITCNPTFSGCIFSGNSADYRGGAIYSDIDSKTGISDCVFTNNTARLGGGMRTDSRTELVITGCRFYENSAENGGGLESASGSLTASDCVFERNSASNKGGGIYTGTFADAVSSVVSNCILAGNTAGEDGGGVYNRSGNRNLSMMMANCTLSGNSAVRGGGVYNSGSAETMVVRVVNSILWGDIPSEIETSGGAVLDVSYSDVDGGWTGYKNIEADPCFADPAGGDYHVRSKAGRWDPIPGMWVQDGVTSECVDGGSPMSPLGDEPWPHGKLVNIGAYGGTREGSMSLSQVGNAADLNNDDIVTFGDFARLGAAWQEMTVPSAADLNRDVRSDFEDVLIFADNWLDDKRVFLPCDDFNDGVRSVLWLSEVNDPTNCRLEEIDERLEVRATSEAVDGRATYVSDGWALDVDRDFSLRIDYHYSRINNGDGWVLIQVLPNSTEVSEDCRIELSAGYSANWAYYYYEVVAGACSAKTWDYRSINDGTFYVSYDSTADELYVSTSGYGRQNAYRTASGVLHGVWGHSPVRVRLGGGSVGAMLESGSAYLDNFVVENGALR